MRSNDAIQQLLLAEEDGKKLIEQARQKAQLLIKEAKENAQAEVSEFVKEQERQLQDLKNANQEALASTEKELAAKVEKELESIRSYAEANMNEAVNMIVDYVFDV
ncbi:V-type proton ATPase subunit G [Spironucleus salmonicida]|uniref:V-type proton ATPase subunit G n=1 Tax=Spironucleus salmonicida TaxID=348837 RepID=V6LDV9_9EUKA|nr:V-type proton ATPase subunit G [Spironucleus salmonicida]|eukprot:EST42675.1 V-type proton ATPase subunit G [Spironucleus salmonicida]